MRNQYPIGALIKAKKSNHNQLVCWRIIEIHGNCSGVNYLCEIVNNSADNSTRIIQSFKETDIEEVK